MSKRSSFPRRKHDKYSTPIEPIRRLLPFLQPWTVFAEPCAGNGALIKGFERYGHACQFACDIRPERKWIERRDARTLDQRWRRSNAAKVFITNPPWTRPLLHELIEHLPTLLPTWLLFDADWMHTDQSAPYLDRCSHIVSAGRVKWIPGSKHVGKDNAAWYYFPKFHTGGPKFTGPKGV